jgi:hypothetical protein
VRGGSAPTGIERNDSCGARRQGSPAIAASA